jgi:hypothetical protein
VIDKEGYSSKFDACTIEIKSVSKFGIEHWCRLELSMLNTEACVGLPALSQVIAEWAVYQLASCE